MIDRCILVLTKMQVADSGLTKFTTFLSLPFVSVKGLIEVYQPCQYIARDYFSSNWYFVVLNANVILTVAINIKEHTMSKNTIFAQLFDAKCPAKFTYETKMLRSKCSTKA